MKHVGEQTFRAMNEVKGTFGSNELFASKDAGILLKGAVGRTEAVYPLASESIENGTPNDCFDFSILLSSYEQYGRPCLKKLHYGS